MISLAWANYVQKICKTRHEWTSNERLIRTWYLEYNMLIILRLELNNSNIQQHSHSSEYQLLTFSLQHIKCTINVTKNNLNLGSSNILKSINPPCLSSLLAAPWRLPVVPPAKFFFKTAPKARISSALSVPISPWAIGTFHISHWDYCCYWRNEKI